MSEATETIEMIGATEMSETREATRMRRARPTETRVMTLIDATTGKRRRAAAARINAEGRSTPTASE
jgi:hypothetical protein